jgi:predicted secreted hydrolase
MKRRTLLLWLLASPAASRAEVRRGRALVFPRDHGAHPETRTEWWYATGWLGDPAAPTFGFQITFFRSRTGLAADAPGRFAARQLLFAHAAVTDLGGQRHLHAQRIARWSGDATSALGRAALDDTSVRIGAWSLERERAGYRALLPTDDFKLDLLLEPTQPLLLQGDAGFSRKGPEERQASHYYSQPQLTVQGRIELAGRTLPASGRAWLDHEWSDEILHPEAVGWDWIGMNLFDGSALTAFRLRRADGSALWAGGSFREAASPVRAFAADAVRFEPGRTWTSPASQARYPVQWQVQTPAGRFEVRSLMDAQELDSRGSTGAIYWEGLAELLDAQGRRVGLGYLEMTGYAARLQIN